MRAESNMLDGACPYYDTYECADGKYVAVGALEPQFFALLLKGLGLDPTRFADRTDTARWPAIKAEFAAMFRGQSRDHWAAVFDGHGRLRRAGARPGGSAAPSAQRRARHLLRPRDGHASGAEPTLLPHAARPSPARPCGAAPMATPRSPIGASPPREIAALRGG